MLYCRLIYTLSMLYVRLRIKVNEGIPESFKVGWYPHKITGSSHLNCKLGNRKFAYGHLFRTNQRPPCSEAFSSYYSATDLTNLFLISYNFYVYFFLSALLNLSTQRELPACKKGNRIRLHAGKREQKSRRFIDFIK